MMIIIILMMIIIIIMMIIVTIMIIIIMVFVMVVGDAQQEKLIPRSDELREEGNREFQCGKLKRLDSSSIITVDHHHHHQRHLEHHHHQGSCMLHSSPSARTHQPRGPGQGSSSSVRKQVTTSSSIQSKSMSHIAQEEFAQVCMFVCL